MSRNVHGVCQGEELGEVLSISEAYGKVAGEAEETQLGEGTARAVLGLYLQDGKGVNNSC